MLWSIITQLNSILFKDFGVEWDRFNFLAKAISKFLCD